MAREERELQLRKLLIVGIVGKECEVVQWAIMSGDDCREVRLQERFSLSAEADQVQTHRLDVVGEGGHVDGPRAETSAD